MALLFECMGKCCRNTLDTAAIVRDACFRQLRIAKCKRTGQWMGIADPAIATSRTPPWRPSEWGFRDLHVSIMRENPGKRSWLLWYLRIGHTRAPVPGVREPRSADFRPLRDGPEFSGTRSQRQRPV